MEVKLTDIEANNVKIALVQLAKSPSIPEDAMMELILLSKKFDVEPRPVETKDTKRGNKQGTSK